MQSWRLGIKAVAIYRDGSKGAQPLNVSTDKQKADDKAEKAESRHRSRCPIRRVFRDEWVSPPPRWTSTKP